MGLSDEMAEELKGRVFKPIFWIKAITKTAIGVAFVSLVVAVFLEAYKRLFTHQVSPYVYASYRRAHSPATGLASEFFRMLGKIGTDKNR